MKTTEEIENKIYEIITHNSTSECQKKLVALFNQALTSHTEELKKKIEGKITGSSTDEGKAYNQGIRDALSELNHQL